MPLFVLLVLLGIRAIISDFREKKIRNSDLLLAFGAGILIYAVQFASGKLAVSWPLFLSSMGLAVVLAAALYMTDSWAGGDAKFFLVVCFLLPSYPYFPLLPLPSAVIFLMTFFLCSVYFAMVSIFLLPSHPILFRKTFQWNHLAKNLSLSFFIVLCLSWILAAGLRNPVFQTMPFLKIALLYLGYALIWKFSVRFKKTFFFWIFGCLSLFVRVFVEPAQLSPVLAGGTLLRITVYSTVFYILNSLILFYRECSISKQKFVFAHFIFCSAVLAYTPFFCWVLKGFQCLQRISLH